MAENTTPKTEDSDDKITFSEASSGLSFFVNAPSKKDILKKLGGRWNQSKKAYSFLARDLATVEMTLGLKAGESGIKDPSRFFKIVLSGEVQCDEGFNAASKKLEEAGFVWNKSRKVFEGKVADYEKIKDILAK